MTAENEIPYFTADDLIDAVAHDFVDLEINGKLTKVRPMTGLELLEGVKRFPSIVGILPGSGETVNVMSVLVDCGREAVAYLIACTFDKAGDAKFFEKIKKAPDSFLVPALSKALSLFLGRSPDDFFMRYGPILASVWIEMQPQAKPEPTEANREGVIVQQAA